MFSQTRYGDDGTMTSTSTAAPASPAHDPHERIGPMAVLPLFHKLAGRVVLLVAGGPGAAWKAELLLAAGARLRVVLMAQDGELEALVAGHPQLESLVRRAPAPSDLDGVSLAVAAIADETEAQAFAAEAKARGVTLNVVDKPELCDVQFGAIVNRSPLLIGISSAGGAPTLAQSVRATIEAACPAGLARWAEVAQGWRAPVAGRLDARGRKAFWRAFAARAMAAPEATPDAGVFTALVREAEAEAAPHRPGTVTAIAAPDDVLALSLNEARALQTADVLLVDPSTPTAVTAYARREAERRLLARANHAAAAEALAAEGLRVVSLSARAAPALVNTPQEPAVDPRLPLALAAIDAANAADPARIVVDGLPRPAALAYGERMSAMLAHHRPEAEPLLQIAARGQHIERWLRPRGDYPEGRAGYFAWRRAAKGYHAERLAAIMAACGYGAAEQEKVGALVRKDAMKQDPAAQLLQDIVCFVFLQHEAIDFAAKHPAEKLMDILRKTLAKMSDWGRGAALALPLPNAVVGLVTQALAEPPPSAAA